MQDLGVLGGGRNAHAVPMKCTLFATYQQQVSDNYIQAFTACVFNFVQSCLLIFGFERKILSLASHRFEGFGCGSVVVFSESGLVMVKLVTV